MLRRLFLPLLFGLAGAAILVSLGVWQVQRLAWKEGILAEIEARIGDTPVALPEAPDPEADKYQPVTTSGRFTGQALRFLASRKTTGAGYRIVEGFETESGRRIMVDRGFIPLPEGDAYTPGTESGVTVTGNLHWPDETSSSTPAPDRERNIWFARDVPVMADALGTEPVLVVARDLPANPPALVPLPVGTQGIPNDHLQYAITWFSLALVWLGMTGYYIRRQWLKDRA
ncbi:SURF1 family protein [Aquicoccus sp. SCR17]|nr:SURF1 family protein [Carideicomes alvinocaridis]